jgi:hypothetical protein
MYMVTGFGRDPDLACPTFVHRALREFVPFSSGHFKFYEGVEGVESHVTL